MDALVVSIIFFLITGAAAFFPFALALGGRAAESPKVFLLAGGIALIFAGANVILAHRRAAGRFLPRLFASLGMSIAFWMAAYPFYHNWLCPVCLLTGGRHKAQLLGYVVVAVVGLIGFVLAWVVTGWGKVTSSPTSSFKQS
ncbi:MAG: hypothetical protein L0Y74_06655 [candidate division Zixibacteria bacterium]|nr:hypothetical protein [candidate division Zixibacteria bacterium]